MGEKVKEFVENLNSGKGSTLGASKGIKMPQVTIPEMPKLPEEFENKLNYLERIASALERIAKALEEKNQR